MPRKNSSSPNAAAATAGLVQLITGTVALFFMSRVPYSLYALALSFGVYQILFGIWIAAKYRR